MPDGCPVVPLGASGSHIVLLDSQCHLRRVKNADVVREAEQQAICARDLPWLEQTYPVFKGPLKRGVARETVSGKWDVKAFGRALMVVAASQAGGFSPNRERGPGAYAGRGGHLILHCGDCLWVTGRMAPLGLRDGFVYTVGEEALPRPWEHRVEAGPDGPGARLLAHYGQWNFRRQIDRLLVVGWQAESLIAGALPRRGMLWIVGDVGSGKTEIKAFQQGVSGPWLLVSSDATAAGIQQRLGRQRISVSVDELEGDEQPDRATALLKIMRDAHSGTETLRGTADHAPVGFSLYSAICAFAVMPPPMTAADRSRGPIAQLDPHEKVELRAMAPGEMEILGRQLLRLMVDRWGWLQSTCLPAWRNLLMAGGFDHRDVDALGVLLACAWTVIHNDPPTEADFYRYETDFLAILDEVRADREPGWQRLLGYMFSKVIDAGRGLERRSVGQLLRQAIGSTKAGWRQRDLLEDVTPDMRDARQLLGQLGLRIDLAEAGVPGIRAGAPVLLVANQCAALSEMLRGSPWEGSAGRSSVWRGVLARFPAAYVPRGPKHFLFGKQRVVALPLAELVLRMLGSGGVDAASDAEAE
jgi:hypothetical protein